MCYILAGGKEDEERDKHDEQNLFDFKYCGHEKNFEILHPKKHSVEAIIFFVLVVLLVLFILSICYYRWKVNINFILVFNLIYINNLNKFLFAFNFVCIFIYIILFLKKIVFFCSYENKFGRVLLINFY